MTQLAYSSARLRDVVATPAQPAGSEESVRIVPRDRPLNRVEEKAPAEEPDAANVKLEDDLVITDLEECPNIDNLVQRTRSLASTPVKPAQKAAAPAKKAASPASTPPSTPRTADRSFSLFEGRVPTPRLKNVGSRHHFDRTTKISSNNAVDEKIALLAGRCDTPHMRVQGGSRHHLDSTTPARTAAPDPVPVSAPASAPALVSAGTQPFVPVLSEKVLEKLDFASPAKNGAPAKNRWAQDLDSTVLSRASSCTSLASETLKKAKQRDTNFWR